MAALFATTAACSSSPTIKTDHTVKICIQKEDWQRLEPLMKTFGARHDMQLYGEIEPMSNDHRPVLLHDHLNYALIRGVHQFRRDDFDLWLVSNPFAQHIVNLNVLSRDMLTANERETESAFLQALQPLTCTADQERVRSPPGAEIRNVR
jgi:hypothetical protein